jgi:quercetin dioxygenase-like cupin family protein
MKKNFEKYNIPQGNIMIAFSDKSLSIGTIEIRPGQELKKHNRPVLESLYQLEGACLMKIYESERKVIEKVLKPGDSINIESKKYHIHSNPFNKNSITLWKANGDITEIIKDIRKNSEL